MTSDVLRPRGGFTLIEALVAASITALLALLSLSLLSGAAAPLTDATLRAEGASRGQAALERLVVELQGGVDVAIGSWDPAGGFQPDQASDSLDPARVVMAGRAVRFRRVLGWDAAINGPRLDAEYTIYAFVPGEPVNGQDDDRDNLLDELQLVRVWGAGGPIVLLDHVLREGDLPASSYAPGGGLGLDRSLVPAQTPPGPFFLLTRPAELELRYRVQAVTGYAPDAPGSRAPDLLPGRLYALTSFARVVNVRNLNQ